MFCLHVLGDCLHQVSRQHSNPARHPQPRVRCHAKGVRSPLPAQPPPPPLNHAHALHTNANDPGDEQINPTGIAIWVTLRQPTHPEFTIPKIKLNADGRHSMYIICIITGKHISPQHALEQHQLRPRIHHHPSITLSHGHGHFFISASLRSSALI